MRISTCQRRSRRSRRSTFALDCIISRYASGVNEVKVDVSNVNDETWYLCVAEMARRGLFVTGSLDRVIPWISRV